MSLSKAQEIELLDHCIGIFTKDSYIGATLTDQREAIIADIRDDIAPLQLTHLYDHQRQMSADTARIEKECRDARTSLAQLKEQIAEAGEKLRQTRYNYENLLVRYHGEARERIGSLLAMLKDSAPKLKAA
jgi:tryptophanyl-tRNA synthetase